MRSAAHGGNCAALARLQSIPRTKARVRLLQVLVQQLEIPEQRPYIFVAHQSLQRVNIHAGARAANGERSTEAMQRRRRNTRPTRPIRDHIPQAPIGHAFYILCDE